MVAHSPSTASGSGSSTSLPGTISSSALCSSGRKRTSCRASIPSISIIDLPSFRADPERHGSRGETVIAVNFDEEAHPDRRHFLRRRDEEVGVRSAEFRPSAAGHHADALLGEHRPEGRHRDLFRASRHRQDDLVGRSQPHAHWRRRAWLVGHRGLQFRGRLLREDDPAVGRGRAGDFRDHQALRHRARECRDGSGHARARPRRRRASPRTAAALIRSTSSPIRPKRTWGRCRRTW